MQKTILICDQCGNEHRESNNWFVGVSIESPPRLMIGPIGCEDTVVGQGKRVNHLCGIACALKRTNDFLDELLKSPGGPGE